MELPSDEELLRATYVLADFGTSQPEGLDRDRMVSSLDLRAPEVLLGRAMGQASGHMVIRVSADKYLNAGGTLRKEIALFDMPLEVLIGLVNIVPDGEVRAMATVL
ncbi:hypothetical protein EUX98_g3235 [Antrodiella citrinella]|uniref:Uncharacterized protein n=1 Tax=Antrodiella citrinella TaxID=2447956 RepID=A0A4S4MX32_9APHY|nr:hypothetical protein EUX98_g3235 [Antrodiella citrinella]